MATLRTLSLLTLVAACGGGRADGFDRRLELVGPLPLKDRVAYLDAAREQLVLVRPAGAGAELGRVPTGPAPLLVAATPDRSRALVLTRGREGLRVGQREEPPALLVIDPSGAAELARYPLESPFDRLAISPDGRFAVASFAGAVDPEGAVLRNPNELAIVDLQAPPDPERNPVRRSVRAFGAAPTAIAFSPPMAVAGAADPTPRSLAVVLAPSVVTLIELEHPERREVSVRLTTSDADAPILPLEVLFAPEAGALFVRATGAPDVYALALGAGAREEGGSELRPTIDLLGVGPQVADAVIYADPATGERKVLAADPSARAITVVDARSGAATQVAIGEPIDRIALFPAAAPEVAVLLAVGARTPRAALVPLDGLERRGALGLTLVGLPRGVADALEVPGRRALLLAHDDARAVLSILDVDAAAVAPIEGSGPLGTFAFAGAGRYLVGGTPGLARLGVIDLDDLHPVDVRLDAAPARVVALEGDLLWVDHGSALGEATVLPSPRAGRAEAHVLRGFLLDAILDDRLED